MGGFDTAKLEAEFFPEGNIRANFIINIGYGDDEKLFPRNPRLSSTRWRQFSESFVLQIRGGWMAEKFWSSII